VNFGRKSQIFPLLKLLILKDISEASEHSILFRGNSMASKIIGLYVKMLGISYLKNVIQPILDVIRMFESVKNRKSIEIDPSKINPEQDIEENLKNLKVITQQVLDGICGSADQLPSTIRAISHFVYTEVGRVFPGFEYVGVGNFLFLRFICPALISPESYGLSEEHRHRSILLITKILQKLANGGKFGNKEEFMDPLNDFLDENQPKMIQFLDHCATSSVYKDDMRMEVSDSTWKSSITGIANLMKSNMTKLRQELQTYRVESLETNISDVLHDICS